MTVNRVAGEQDISCGGFVARSLVETFSSLSIEGERKKRAFYSTTDVAERASKWLWLKREESWNHGS